jgi:hypothetical protein
VDEIAIKPTQQGTARTRHFIIRAKISVMVPGYHLEPSPTHKSQIALAAISIIAIQRNSDLFWAIIIGVMGAFDQDDCGQERNGRPKIKCERGLTEKLSEDRPALKP